jgi:hypothetical protein
MLHYILSKNNTYIYFNYYSIKLHTTKLSDTNGEVVVLQLMS